MGWGSCGCDSSLAPALRSTAVSKHLAAPGDESLAGSRDAGAAKAAASRCEPLPDQERDRTQKRKRGETAISRYGIALDRGGEQSTGCSCRKRRHSQTPRVEKHHSCLRKIRGCHQQSVSHSHTNQEENRIVLLVAALDRRHYAPWRHRKCSYLRLRRRTRATDRRRSVTPRSGIAGASHHGSWRRRRAPSADHRPCPWGERSARS